MVTEEDVTPEGELSDEIPDYEREAEPDHEDFPREGSDDDRL